MGTRSNIQFRYGTEKFQVYKHWDGYPDNMIPHLVKFLEWNGVRNDDISYTMANYILYVKLEYYLEMDDKVMSDFKNPQSNIGNLHTGIGLVNVCEPKDISAESWIEYMYIVDLKTKKIEVYDPNKCIYVFDFGENLKNFKEPEK